MVFIYFAIVFAESLIHSTMRDSKVFDSEKQLLNVVVFATYQSSEAKNLVLCYAKIIDR